MKQIINSSTKWTRFGSTIEMGNYLSSASPSGAFRGLDEYELASNYNSSERCKTDSFDQANELLKTGDFESYSKLDKNWAIPPIQGKRPAVTLGVVGFAPCVPAYLMGLPVQMYCSTTAPAKVHTVDVCYNCSVCWGVEADEMIARANKFFNIIEYLENNGIGVNLYCCCSSESSGEIAGFIVKIKSSNERISLYNAAYSLINPSFLRRHYSRYVEVIGVKNKSFRGGYGRPTAKSKIEPLCGCNVIEYYDVKSKSPEELINRMLRA